MSGTATRRRTPPAGITDRLADLNRRTLNLIVDPLACRSCTDAPCPLHQLRKDILAALHDLDKPEAP